MGWVLACGPFPALSPGRHSAAPSNMLGEDPDHWLASMSLVGLQTLLHTFHADSNMSDHPSM